MVEMVGFEPTTPRSSSERYYQTELHLHNQPASPIKASKTSNKNGLPLVARGRRFLVYGERLFLQNVLPFTGNHRLSQRAQKIEALRVRIEQGQQ